MANVGIWIPGPVAIWLGVGSSNAPLFFGHSERGIQLSRRVRTTEVFSDLGGTAPHDVLYGGEDALAMADMMRYDETVYNYASDRSRPGAGATPGVDVPGNIGTLLMTEGKTFPMWLSCPYLAKAAQAGQLGGYHFYAAYLLNEDIGPMGTQQPKKIRVGFHCLRQFSATLLSNAAGQGSWFLYDRDMSAISGLTFT